ncbi:MAG: TonB-dependent receptor plug domain-containing protein [Polyangiaceae bacterium]|nr:TonB-dependent receptor plug domain-containing protein [Polyangiaceae bacterium]
MTLTVTVQADGAVRTAVPVEENEPFSGLAATAALGWRFEPATRGGERVAAKVRVEVTFREPAPPPPDDEETSARGPAGVGAAAAPPPPPPSEVTVLGVRPEPSRTATLTRAEVRQIPGAFGDPFRAIEVMPGVTPIVSGLPFFFIRGAPPGNVGYYLDGVRLPLLFHVGVGPSVVHPALVSRVDLYPGGYPARYGRFAGGIVAGETAPPEGELHGEYNVRLFDAGALVETPFDGGKGSALVGGRYSYTAALLTQLQSDTLLNYWDYQARVGYDVGRDDRLSVFAFGSYDYLGQKTPTGTLTLFGTEFHRVDLRHDHRFGASGSLRTAVTLGLDRSRLPDDRYVRNRLLGARTEYVQRLSPRALLRAGTDLQMDSYDIELGTEDFNPSTQRVVDLFPTRTDAAFGARLDLVLEPVKGFEVTPGVRADFYSSQGATAFGVDPRLAARTELSSRARLLTALGLAHQPPSFAVPVPGFQPGGLRGGLQKAAQESVGLEFDLEEATTATLTVFHNTFFSMSDPLGSRRADTGGCLPGQFPTDSLGGDRGEPPPAAAPCGVPRFSPGTLGPDRSGGGDQGADSAGARRTAEAFEVRTLGSSYGLELFLKRRLTSHLGGFLSYTVSRSTRSVGDRKFIATFDRTHVANVAAAYDLGRRWRAGGRVVFYTGLPRLPTPDNDATRLPAFFRVDVRLEKRWQLGPKAFLSAVAEWMNATLSKEAVTTTCNLGGCEAQRIGPVSIPSLGIEGGF